MDEIKRIREAIATGEHKLTDIEKGVMAENAKTLGMSGKYHIEKLLSKINEDGNKQPVIVMRIISNYITRLERQVTRYKESLGLDAKARAERKAQLEAMKVDVEKLTRVLDDGVIQAVTQGHEYLATRLRKFDEGLEATVDKESITSDPLGTWYRTATGLTSEALRRTVAFVEEVVRQAEDPLIPLRKSVKRAMELVQVAERLEPDPGEAGLRDLT
jgi:hypothetical protein